MVTYIDALHLKLFLHSCYRLKGHVSLATVGQVQVDGDPATAHSSGKP